MKTLLMQHALTRPLFYYARMGMSGISLAFKTLKKGKGFIKVNHPQLRHPLFLRKGTSDVETFEQIFVALDYDMDYGFDPKVIIDCGANIGLAAVFFKNKFPGARIYSVEPELSNYEMLVKNTEAYEGITTYNKGIWNKSTKLRIENKSVEKWAFEVFEAKEGEPFDVEAISINDIVREHNIDRIDILKIDIEGSEKDLFAMNFEEWLSKTRVLIIELHDNMRAGSSKALYKALMPYDFELAKRGENGVYLIKGVSAPE